MQALEPIRPRDYTPAQLALVKRTVAAECNDDEFNLFIEVCRRVGLDPFRRQIYAVVYNKDKPDKRKMAIITGIDGFRAVAARNRDYRPDDNEPEFHSSPDLVSASVNPLGLIKAVVKCFKLSPNGEWYPVVGVARWEEFAPLTEVWAEDFETGKRKPTGEYVLDRRSNWYKMPHVMLAKCAEAQAVRKGWPEDLSGVYATEEMARAIDVSASEVVEAHKAEERLKRIGGLNAIAIQWSVAQPLEMVPIGKVADRVIEYVERAEHPDQLFSFMDMNKVSLQQFWAVAKNDALAVKQQIEQKAKALAAAKEREEAEANRAS